MKKIILSLLMLSFLALPALTYAGPDLGLEYGQATGLGQSDVRLTVARLINISLSILGTIAVVLVLFAGFKWMTAGGDEGKVSEAKKILTASVIGLAVILSAYSISRFAIQSLYKATTGYDYRE